MLRKLSTLIPTATTTLIVLLATIPAVPTASGQPPATSTGECVRRLGGAPSAARSTLPLPLRATTWNTMKYSQPGAPLMLTALAAESDLLLLQESLRDGAPASEHASRLFAAGYVSGGATSGVEIRSRVAADVRCTLTFTEPWLRTPKAIAAARYPLASGEHLLVVNLHAINFTLGITNYQRQMEAIAALAAAHRGPVLVGGDFNNWSDARDAIAHRAFAAQDLTAVPVTPDLRSRHLGMPIDGFYVRGMRSADASAYPTEASDHHPVTAILLATPERPRAADTPAPAPAHTAAQH